jgi:dihydrolipoamide dehydrogenase
VSDALQERNVSELEEKLAASTASLEKLSNERDQYKKLYLDTLELCRSNFDVVVSAQVLAATWLRSARPSPKALETEMLLVSVGRKPVIEDLGLETVSVKTDRGFVVADALGRTNVEGIWAIGDLIPTLALAHVASHEGIVVADAIAGKNPAPINYNRAPCATYTYPEVASVGLSEKRAREQGHEVKTGMFPFSAIGKATISGENDGFVKIVSDKRYDEVLGVHIVGPHATELIAEACAALELETTTEDLARTIHAHPTLSESVGEAAHAVLGHTINL